MCLQDKPSKEFVKGMYLSRKGSGYSRCLQCHRDYGKLLSQWRKLLVLKHYSPEPEGPKCACKGCGENRVEFLVIDHVNGGGNLHRRVTGNGASAYRWILKNGFPPGFRVLCWNCNNSLGAFGYCPHESASRFSLSILQRFGARLQGERKPNAKLTDADVQEILSGLKAGESQAAIAKRFGVSRGLVGGIARGERWIRRSPALPSEAGPVVQVIGR